MQKNFLNCLFIYCYIHSTESLWDSRPIKISLLNSANLKPINLDIHAHIFHALYTHRHTKLNHVKYCYFLKASQAPLILFLFAVLDLSGYFIASEHFIIM